jgi:aconitate hydratase
MAFDIELIRSVYSIIPERVEKARKVLGRPLTLSEKILYSHLWDGEASKDYVRGKDYVDFKVDRVAMQDATAQMALLQFMLAGKKKVAVPSSVHLDHLIQAHAGADKDLQEALNKNDEVFNFLASISKKYGIGFWKPGAGIIHQVVLENYAFPGGLMIGTDSHTVNAGGLGMVAIGVGGADAVDVMADMPWELKWPKLIGIKLTGKLSGWTSPKDIILKVAGILTVKGGTGAIIEYFGPGAESLSATGKGTICNMGAEVGATNSNFAYDDAMERYLRATGRDDVADAANKIREHLRSDAEVYANPEKYYDELHEINLDTLKPHLNGPFTPDRDTPIDEMAQLARENDWPLEVQWGLIGSCTNSSYEDLSRAASIAKQALDKGIKLKAQLGINPGSEQVRYTAEKDGILKLFEDLGAVIFTNACGPCIGQWRRDGIAGNPKNTIVHSFNRNFAKRADGNPNTHAFVASPEIVMALSIAGKLDFDPSRDFVFNEKGESILLQEPKGWELPPDGFKVEDAGYIPPAEDGSEIDIIVNPLSDRLQLLSPFKAWNGENITGAPLLIKVIGKCTTDHISMAGPWLKYRGHLDNISDNMLIGGVNAFNNKIGETINPLNGEYESVPKVARALKGTGKLSVIVGDQNYGEGSSREHAAMEPKHLGVIAVLVKSFARIHETNLKKQGMLAITFSNEADYDKIREKDELNFIDLRDFAPGKQITIELDHQDGTKDTIKVNHTYNEQQIEWFRAGSALNYLRK